MEELQDVVSNRSCTNNAWLDGINAKRIHIFTNEKRTPYGETTSVRSYACKSLCELVSGYKPPVR
jgi:hypothetical protein